MKEMVSVVSSLIKEVQIIKNRLMNLEFLVDSYYEWKDEKGDLQQYVKTRLDKIKREDKNRTTNSTTNK